MAQYATNFSEYVTGSQPSDWTRRYVADHTWEIAEDATATGGKLLRCPEETSVAQNGLSWDLLDSDPDRANCKIFMRVRFPGATANAELLAMVRGQGSAGSSHLYRHGPRPRFGNLELNKYVDGVFSDFLQKPTTFTSGVFYNVMIRVVDSLHEIKAWEVGQTEPTIWAEATDTDITGVGYVGLFRYQTDPVDVDFYSVGTGGDEPLREVPGATVSVTQAEISVGGTLNGTASGFDAEPTSLTLSDGASPNYTPTPTFTANGSDWDFSATIENFAAQAKAAGEGVPVQGLIPGTITVTVE